MSAKFERLIAEAEGQPFSGWDFAFLEGRYLEGKVSWDFAQEARTVIGNAGSMLDLGTGGGELLASLAPLPSACCATEGYEPNLHIARDRLGPMGVDVVCILCDDNAVEPQRGELPFRDVTFDLVMDRHEAFVANEVARVLKPDGIFVTQQVGEDNNLELREFFGRNSRSEEKRRAPWNLARATREIEFAGMKTLQKKEENVTSRFLDVGALVYYLKAIPWEIPGFSVRRYSKELFELHETIERTGRFTVTTSRFYIQARRE